MKAQESKGATHGEGPVGKVSLLSLALGKKSLNALGLLIEELLEGPFQAILLVLDLHNHLANSVLQSRQSLQPRPDWQFGYEGWPRSVWTRPVHQGEVARPAAWRNELPAQGSFDCKGSAEPEAR